MGGSLSTEVSFQGSCSYNHYKGVQATSAEVQHTIKVFSFRQNQASRVAGDYFTGRSKIYILFN
jgi:hypothetical protein